VLVDRTGGVVAHSLCSNRQSPVALASRCRPAPQAAEAPICSGSPALLQSAEWQTAEHPTLSARCSNARPARQARPPAAPGHRRPPQPPGFWKCGGEEKREKTEDRRTEPVGDSGYSRVCLRVGPWRRGSLGEAGPMANGPCWACA